MRKAVVASILAVASAAPGARFGFSQATAAPAQGTGVQMAQAEYNDYTAAENQTPRPRLLRSKRT